ncbi:MAG: hypothetical protein ACFB4I_10625 [Cyanophyceae cyanobacterium]
MTVTIKRLTLTEYLDYQDGADQRYELVSGELVEESPESDMNNLIAMYLHRCFVSTCTYSAAPARHRNYRQWLSYHGTSTRSDGSE